MIVKKETSIEVLETNWNRYIAVPFIILIVIAWWLVYKSHPAEHELVIKNILLSSVFVVAYVLFLILVKPHRNLYLVISKDGVGFPNGRYFYEYGWNEIEEIFVRKRHLYVKPKGELAVKLQVHKHVLFLRPIETAIHRYSGGIF